MTIAESNLRTALAAVLTAIRPYTQDDEAGRPWLTAAKEALVVTPDTPLETAYREQANTEWASDEIEIDDDAIVSIGDQGAFIQAWVFVSNSDMPIECSDCDALVNLDDPYYGSPCGTFCEPCMREKHAPGCGICAAEFDLATEED